MKASDIRTAATELLFAFFSRLLITPLTFLIPRDSGFCVVIGRENGKFLDNAKHYFCWLQRNQPVGHRSAFITEFTEVAKLLGTHQAPALIYPRPRALWALLRAGTVVVDSVDQLDHGRVAFLRKARFVQLWHGAPMKEIELPLHKRRLAKLTPVKRSVLRALKAITGRYRTSDLLISTSTFFSEHAFSRCFSAKHIIATGYPRNDAILCKPEDLTSLAMANVDGDALASIRAARLAGTKIILYAPTFRASRSSPFAEGGADLARWSASAKESNYLLALKLHPVMARHHQLQTLDSVLDISPASDIYPILPEIDLLVTDYSSIYFDYLLLDRPIVFFPYDYEHYTTQDRHLLFNYDDMTPGPKTRTFPELLRAIPKNLMQADEWRNHRSRVRNLTFDDIDASASARIWKALHD